MRTARARGATPPDAYAELAAVYEFTVPEAMLSPAGSVAAFGQFAAGLGAGGSVLDCACGIGMLAVGLAEAGCEVAATDASPAMVARTRALAAQHGVALDTDVCAWEDLGHRGWQGRFDAVFCVGNSLAHAPGRAARLNALRAMAGVMRGGGTLVVTSRNWELVRTRAPGIDVADAVIERGGRRGLLIYDWHTAGGWRERHDVDIAVALLAAGTDAVETHATRLAYWPFEHAELTQDLEAAGLAPEASTYEPRSERYLVSARR